MRVSSIALIVGFASAIAAPAYAADRPPTAAERAAIEKVLRAQGFVSWEEIEYDDDSPRRAPAWDVDDARTKDGKAFDLKLQPGTLKVLKRTPD